MRKLFSVLGVGVWCFVSITEISAKTIHVPGDYSTIQGGLNVATGGDTVLVAPGTYYENINWPQIDGITLLSEAGPESTTINGLFGGSVISFYGNTATFRATIEGFTIMWGWASRGGGIYSYRFNPLIVGNIIVENYAETDGGAIYLWRCHQPPPEIRGNRIRGNSAGRYGGGIYLDGCQFTIIESNEISKNVSKEGGGIYATRGGYIVSNIIYSNSGGGIFFEYSAYEFLIMRNVIYHNADEPSIYVNASKLLLQQNLIVSNPNCGIQIPSGSAPTIKLNAIIDNLSAIRNEGSPSLPGITLNNFYYNTFQDEAYELYNYNPEQLNASYNFWWVTDSAQIDSLIYGDVNFTPFLTDFAPTAPGEPSTVNSLNFFSDSTYSTLPTYLDIGDTIYIELSGNSRNAALYDYAVVILSSDSDTHGIAVALIETDIATGTYRGFAIVDTVSNDPYNRIRTKHGGFIIARANMDSTRVDTAFMLILPPTLAQEPPYTQGLENTIYWTPTGAEYLCQCSFGPGFGTIFQTSGWISDTFHTFTGLTDGTKYYYRVKTRNAIGLESDWSNVVSSTQDATAPNTPFLLSPISDVYLNDSSVVFWWTEIVEDTTCSPVRYILQVDTNISFPSPIIDTATANSDTIVLRDGNYYWRVRAYDLAGNQGNFSSSDSFIVDITPPSVPMLVLPPNGIATNDPIPTFIWNVSLDNLSGIDHYILQYANNPDLLDATSVYTTDTTHTPISSLPDATYYWRVKAIDVATNESNWSTVWSFEIDTQIPEIVLIQPIGGVFLNNMTVTLSWSELALRSQREDGSKKRNPSETISSVAKKKSNELGLNCTNHNTVLFAPTRYVLLIATDLLFTDTVLIDTTSATSYITNLSQNFYYWKVKAFDLAGNEGSFSDPDSFGVDITKPSTPTLVSPYNGFCTNVSAPTFVWTASTDNLSGIEYYNLQYANNRDFSDATSVNVADTIYTPTSLSDTIYYWRVKACDRAANQSDWSVVWNFEVDTHAPNVPTLVSPEDSSFLGDTIVIFEWTEVGLKSQGNLNGIGSSSSPVSYVLQVDSSSLFIEPIYIDTTFDNMATVNITEGRYFWRVKAYDLAGNQSNFSPPFYFIVDVTPPNFSGTTVWTDTSFGGPYHVASIVTDALSGVSSVFLYYKFNEGEWNRRAMASMDSLYQAEIPKIDTVAIISYYLRTADLARNEATDPPGAPNNCYSFVRLGIAEHEQSTTPNAFALLQNRPNPFTRTTTIYYQLPIESHVILKIYSFTGQLVRTLVEGRRKTGYYAITWDGRDDTGQEVTPGIYFYRLEARDFKDTKKMVLFR